MLGALIGVTKVVKLESVFEATKKRFGEKLGEINIKAIKKGYGGVSEVG
jgi:Pyruvate/2-oxoacid:ferredoxin oxidoreductase gamma subunit